MTPEHAILPSPGEITGNGHHAPDQRNKMDRFGMILFLVALGILFVAALLVHVITWLTVPRWHEGIIPNLPRTIWVGTGVLLASSWSMWKVVRAVRKDHFKRLRASLELTWKLGWAFLIIQAFNWAVLIVHRVPPTAKSLYAFSFYMLTGLHAAHVLGGMLALWIARKKAAANDYSSVHHEGLAFTAMYWHFLDAVWIATFAVLLLLR